MSFDEMYDQMLADEFRISGAESGGLARSERPRGLARYRSAALVGAGGMACAAVGAFLGGLGGYFTLSPAGAHAVTTSSQDLPLAAAVNSAYAAQPAVGSAAPAAAALASGTTNASGAAAAVFSAVSGPIVHGIAPLQVPTATLPVTAPVSGLPVVGGGSTGGGGTSGGPSDGGNTGNTPSDPVTQATQILDLGLTNILGNLTAALSSLGTLSNNPTGVLNGLVPSLSGVVSDVTGTLMNLSSLMPLQSLPIPGAVGGGLPGLGSLPVVSTAAPGVTTGSPAATAAATKSAATSPTLSGLAPILNGVAAAATGSTGGTVPTIPSLPLPSVGSVPTLPSLPVTMPSGSLPAPPAVGVPSVSSGGNSTTINLPTPSLPVNVGGTLPLGPITIGISTGGTNPGLTLTLP